MPLPSEWSLSDDTTLPLEEQVVRLQALLEASRQVHATIELPHVLQQAARIAVLELELEGALFTDPLISFGRVPGPADEDARRTCARFPLRTQEGRTLCEFLVFPPGCRSLTLYERDFLEGLVLQTSIAAQNAIDYQRHLDYARVAHDLQAARAIQRSLLPQYMPAIAGYSLAGKSTTCYEVGGDYFDVVAEPGGSYLIVIADVAGKGLASALICMSFRSAFRALSLQCLALDELAGRLSQQHWEEGFEARARYVTAIFVRLHAARGELEFVNAGHNPAFVLSVGKEELRTITASATPLGLLSGTRYTTERLSFPPGSRLLLYTDGLTEVFAAEEEFGDERLLAAFRSLNLDSSDLGLDDLWKTIFDFNGHEPQRDDMTAITLCHSQTASQAAS